MKQPIRRNNLYIAKCPENTIIMWVGNVPRAVRKKISLSSGMETQSLHIHFIYCIPYSKTLVEVSLIRPLNELFLQTCDKLLSTNEQVYKNDTVVNICINNQIYRILRNPPRCTKLVLKLKPLVGCPLMASFSLTDDLEKVNPSFHWYVGKPGASLVTPVLNNTLEERSKYTMDGWVYCSTGKYFCPRAEDVGKRICVLLDMGANMTVYCTDSESEVSEVGEMFIFENRQNVFCQKRANSGNVRVISYNILADLYLDLKLKQEDLYFPYCAKEYQDYTYRYPILLREILGYQADIIFLQEVDERLWLRFLPYVMSSNGYDCYFKKKGMKVNEGLVVCFRKELFRFLESHDMWLPDLLNSGVYSENDDIIELFKNNDELKTMFMSKPAVIQVLAVDSSSLFAEESSILLLANTHLYFDPRFEIIKILQSLLCTRWITRLAANYANRNPKANLHILFAGDFNSTPDGAVYRLISTGKISIKREWFAYNHSLQSDVNFSIQSSPSSFKLKLTSLADETQFTNYTRHCRYDGQIAGFEGCLDYIWGSVNVKVQKVIPVPPKELAKKYVALPSKISPSDHLPLVCDIQLQ
uniref:Endonuclease/exonuclease/phosphatase domain-containing protein n=1 Tax=Setaria digitata TaxID=48799 RepID=A0A915PFB4_9BILA